MSVKERFWSRLLLSVFVLLISRLLRASSISIRRWFWGMRLVVLVGPFQFLGLLFSSHLFDS